MARATPGLGNEGPFGSMLGMTPYNDVRFGLLGAIANSAVAIGFGSPLVNGFQLLPPSVDLKMPPFVPPHAPFSHGP